MLDTRTGSYGYKYDQQGYQDRNQRERRPWVERGDRYHGCGYH